MLGATNEVYNTSRFMCEMMTLSNDTFGEENEDRGTMSVAQLCAPYDDRGNRITSRGRLGMAMDLYLRFTSLNEGSGMVYYEGVASDCRTTNNFRASAPVRITRNRRD